MQIQSWFAPIIFCPRVSNKPCLFATSAMPANLFPHCVRESIFFCCLHSNLVRKKRGAQNWLSQHFFLKKKMREVLASERSNKEENKED